ncbi:MAG: hypothetical protein AAF318_05710 [Pseudomonadota bacterium]
MDLCFTDKDGLILEHWDTTSAFVDPTASGAGIVEGPAEPDRSVDTDAYKMLFRLIGEGDRVMINGKRHAVGCDTAVFDRYRAKNGLIAGDWMNDETIAPGAEWGKSGNF